MIYHFDFAVYARMVRLARREPNAKARRGMLLVLLVVVPIVSTIHAICFALDAILFPGLRRMAVAAPVFIVGHARSGTTLAHRLMCVDPGGDGCGRFSVFRLYEMFLPSLIEKKAVRALGWIDARLLGGRIDARIARAEERSMLGATQDMHRTGLKHPEEDDFVLTFSMASGFWIVMAPYMGDLDFYYVDERSPAARRRLMGFYRECVKRQLYLNGPAKIHLSKNPTFCGRVESLIETFPDARFVVLLRDPSETVPSLLKLLQRSWKGRGWDDAAIERSLRVLADQSFHSYRHPLEVLERHPEVRRAIVDYRDLIASPKRTILDVYERLGLETTLEYGEVLEREERRASDHERTYRYSLEEFGLRADEIRVRLADLFERYGWHGEESPAR